MYLYAVASLVIMWTSPAVNRAASPNALSGGGGSAAMVVTFLGWWALTACLSCLLATEIPTGTRAVGGQAPGARLFSEQGAASECGMKNLASLQVKRSAAAALPVASGWQKIEEPEDKSSSLVPLRPWARCVSWPRWALTTP